MMRLSLKSKTKQWAWFFGLYLCSILILGSFFIVAHLITGH
jgi:hypothetical protein